MYHNDNNYILEKPMIKDKNWYIFPSAIFSHISSMDCDNTIDGVCHEDITFDKCINICDKSPMCEYGYYISNLPGKNICVPLKKSLTNINPLYRVRNKNIYPVLKDAQTKVFIDKRKHSFPPEDANTVFYMDNFCIKNVETNTLLETSPISQSNKTLYNNQVMFAKNGDLIVQALQIPPDLDAGVQYVPIKYGDKLVFNIPNTNLIIRDDSKTTNKMEWVSRSFAISNDTSYSISPIMSGKKKGDVVNYSDIFALVSNVTMFSINENYYIEKLYYASYEQAKANNKNVTFKFIPKMIGWYCNNTKCTDISFDKMIINEQNIGTYNGTPILRNPRCWGKCTYNISNHTYQQFNEQSNSKQQLTPSIWVYIIPIIFIIIFIIVKVLKFN